MKTTTPIPNRAYVITDADVLRFALAAWIFGLTLGILLTPTLMDLYGKT